MTAHDFSRQLASVDRACREIYARGYVHGVLSAIGIVAFFAFYFWSAA